MTGVADCPIPLGATHRLRYEGVYENIPSPFDGRHLFRSRRFYGERKRADAR